MIEIYGDNGCAKIFAAEIDDETEKQVRTLMNQPISDGSVVRVMPDCHAGAGCVIGLTMTLTEKICPHLVGVDIGCGMLAAKLENIHGRMDFHRVDEVIRRGIPSGFAVHPFPIAGFDDLENLFCAENVDIDRARQSIGTLGGGNHFIEISFSQEQQEYWLIVHSGSRKLGLDIATHYQKTAVLECKEQGGGRELAFLTGESARRYLHDMGIAQAYACLNRQLMLERICADMCWTPGEVFTTTHNYIDLTHGILRKGAVSARNGERLLIPLNMRDGSLLCRGLGNDEWNQSAPHGAGRIMSRSKARKELSLADFERQMDGVFSSCISRSTLDESPMAYKDSTMTELLLEPTAHVEEHLLPLYNFKAGGD